MRKKVFNSMKKYDANIYGGALLAGCNKLIIKCHGNAKPMAVYHAIKQAKSFYDNDVINIMTNNLS